MEFTETIESRPAMEVNCRSSGVATEFAIVAGSAPGRALDHLPRKSVDLQ
jgi:hypothetical protein